MERHSPKQVKRQNSRLGYSAPMPYMVQRGIDDSALTVITETAKEAFAQAIEWSVAGRYTDVSIHDGSKSYSIHEFALAMALEEIATTLVMANDNDAG
jgi:hypothetical protein